VGAMIFNKPLAFSILYRFLWRDQVTTNI